MADILVSTVNKNELFESFEMILKIIKPESYKLYLYLVVQ